MMRQRREENKKSAGFTMVELLVAVAVGTMVIMLIVAAYWSQTQTNKTQQMMVEMQQNIRAGLVFAQWDIMMAGYEDDPSNPASSSITIATPTQLQFTYADPFSIEDGIDNNNDGQTDEPEEKDGVDNNGDSDTDEINELETVRFVLQGTDLHRMLIEDFTDDIRVDEIVAENIEELEFLYILNDNTITMADLSNPNNNNQQDIRDTIRKIGISVLARTRVETSGYTDERVYLPLSNPVTNDEWGPYNDHFRRELVTTTINCRNM